MPVLVCVMPGNPFAQCLCIMLAKICGLLRSEIFFLVRMEMFLHLFYDMFSLMKVVNFKI